MVINIHAVKLDLTPSMKKYIETKILSLSRLLKRFEEKREILVNFEISRTTRHHKHGEVFYAEANMRLAGKLLRAEAYHADARGAVDAVKDILREGIGSYKESKTSRGKMHRAPKLK